MNRPAAARLGLLAALTVAVPWLVGAATRPPQEADAADGEIQLAYGTGGYSAATCGGVKRTHFEEGALRVQATAPVLPDHQFGIRLDLGAASESSDISERTDDGRERNYSEGRVLWGLRAGLVWDSPWAGAVAGWQWLGNASLPALSARIGGRRLYVYAGMLDGGLSGGFYDGLGILWTADRAPVWFSRAGIGGAWPAMGLSGQIGLTSLELEPLAELTVRRHTDWGSWLVSARLGQLDPDWQVLVGLSMPLFASEAQKAAAPF